MAYGFKTIETRGRKTHIRGQVAIHAARREVGVEGQWLAKDFGELVKEELPKGMIVAVGDLWECWTTEHLKSLRQPISKTELTFGDYTDGRFGWAFRNMVRLPQPVPCKGHQGFFFLPPDVESKVQEQLK